MPVALMTRVSKDATVEKKEAQNGNNEKETADFVVRQLLSRGLRTIPGRTTSRETTTTPKASIKFALRRVDFVLR